MTNQPNQPLVALRDELRDQGLDGFIVPRADEHLGEYVPASAERLAWLTGFTGSAGLAAVLPRRRRCSPTDATSCSLPSRPIRALWQRLHITEKPPHLWLAEHAPKGGIGYDPLLISQEALGPLHRGRP